MIICTTSQIAIERAIMKENEVYFKLAYSSLLFEFQNLQKIGEIGLNNLA